MNGQRFISTPVPVAPQPCSPWLRLAHDFPVEDSVRLFAQPCLGDHALHYFREGSGSYELRGETVPIRPGMLFFVRPGEGYRFTLDPGVRVRMYNLHFDLLENERSYRPFPVPPEACRNQEKYPETLPPHQQLANRPAYEQCFLRLLDAASRIGVEPNSNGSRNCRSSSPSCTATCLCRRGGRPANSTAGRSKRPSQSCRNICPGISASANSLRGSASAAPCSAASSAKRPVRAFSAISSSGSFRRRNPTCFTPGSKSRRSPRNTALRMFPTSHAASARSPERRRARFAKNRRTDKNLAFSPKKFPGCRSILSLHTKPWRLQ